MKRCLSGATPYRPPHTRSAGNAVGAMGRARVACASDALPLGAIPDGALWGRLPTRLYMPAPLVSVIAGMRCIVDMAIHEEAVLGMCPVKHSQPVHPVIYCMSMLQQRHRICADAFRASCPRGAYEPLARHMLYLHAAQVPHP